LTFSLRGSRPQTEKLRRVSLIASATAEGKPYETDFKSLYFSIKVDTSGTFRVCGRDRRSKNSS
jgi:hypothetical protein